MRPLDIAIFYLFNKREGKTLCVCVCMCVCTYMCAWAPVHTRDLGRREQNKGLWVLLPALIILKSTMYNL